MNKTNPIIFVIDDEPGFLDAIKLMLESKNYDVYYFTSIENLLQHELLSKVNLFIIDVVLGSQGDGRDLYNKLCDGGLIAPTLFISGIISDDSFTNIADDCIYDFLEKPFKLVHFLRRVNLLLQMSHKQVLYMEEKERILNLFDSVFEQAPFGMDIIEKNGRWRVIKSSKESRRMTGLNNIEDINSNNYLFFKINILDPHTRKPISINNVPVIRSFLNGEIVRGEHYIIVRPDGTESHASFKSSPIKDKEGKIIAGLQITYDITAVKEAELEVKQKEKAFRKEIEVKLSAWRSDLQTNKRTTLQLQELTKRLANSFSNLEV